MEMGKRKCCFSSPLEGGNCGDGEKKYLFANAKWYVNLKWGVWNLSICSCCNF